jgi:fatty-acid desaturase
LYRGWKYYRKNPKDWLFQSLLTSFILCGIVLATEGVQVLTQFIMPVWFVWGLIEAYMQQKKIIIPNSAGEK